MSRDGDEARSGPGGETTDEGEGQLGSGIHLEHADGHADRKNTGGGEASRVQKRTAGRIRGTYPPNYNDGFKVSPVIKPRNLM